MLPSVLHRALSYAAFLASTLTGYDFGFDFPGGQVALESELAPSAPHFVIYADQYVGGVNGPPAVSQVQGFTVFNLAFLLLAGPWDKAYEWTTLTDSERSSVKQQYNNNGISLMVSAFGATDVPTTSGADPISTANTLADFVLSYDLDGIDIDYEDFGAFDIGQGKAEDWLIRLTKRLRERLPKSGGYIITHAPVAPWFTPTRYAGGGYLRVHEEVGDLIDWYNVQFYNQGANEYTTCSNLLYTSSSTWPQTSIYEIANNGVPLSKLVIGKPARSADASNGYMSASTLASCLEEGRGDGWNGGAMVWQYPGADASWIRTVRSRSWPV